MKRLTARTSKGHAYLVKVKSDEQEVDSKYPNTLKCILECFSCLADYEDTGLTPQEVKELIAENEQLKAKPENNPLTIDEVKELTEGDVVWLKYINGNYPQPIQFAGIVEEFFTYFAFGNEMLCNRFFSGINKVYEIYRNKPDIADVSKKED